MGIVDLARRYHATLESLALQTRHVVQVVSGHPNDNDTKANSAGSIQAIYVSGGQAVSGGVMVQLMADACGVPVVLPDHDLGPSPVVLGAAMLGRYAAEMSEAGGRSDERGERLWRIMVRAEFWCCRLGF